MAVKRRERGTLVEGVQLSWEVEREAKERFERIATRAGLSAALFFESVVAHMELTDQGVPPWVPLPDHDGELPIDSP